MKAGILFLITLLSLSLAKADKVCKGFLPENDLQIPVEAQELGAGGLSEREFNQVLDRVESFYTPRIAALGGQLQLIRAWTDPTVNAHARRVGSTYEVKMFGGLARQKDITPEGFTLVACHEVGHHIGGAPKLNTSMLHWATNEGQADYFAGLKCLRELWTDKENANFVASNWVDPSLRATCNHLWKTRSDRNRCQRIGMAGHSTALLFQWMRRLPSPPRFNTPDRTMVRKTRDDHPGLQCRLDTYFQAALCLKPHTQVLSNTNPHTGACTTAQGYSYGIRPRCWYAQN